MSAGIAESKAPGARMHGEMAEQPEVLERLLARRTAIHARVAAACPERARPTTRNGPRGSGGRTSLAGIRDIRRDFAPASPAPARCVRSYPYIFRESANAPPRGARDGGGERRGGAAARIRSTFGIATAADDHHLGYALLAPQPLRLPVPRGAAPKLVR